MTRLFVASIFTGAIAVAGHAQTQNTIIHGRVIAMDTGEPLPHARVIIYNDATPLPPFFTDGQGRFASRPLGPGRYRLSVSKSGYAVTSIAPADVVSAGDIDVRLPRAAAIAGRVVDRFGEPSAGVIVSLYAQPRAGQAGPGLLVRRMNTDDLGEFRFGGLAEGTYFTAAMSEGTGTGRPIDALRLDINGTFYPGVGTFAEAQGISVRPGDERADIDFTGISSQPDEFTLAAQIVTQPVLLVGPQGTITPTQVKGTAHIRGRVTRGDGLPIIHASVTTNAPFLQLGRIANGRISVQTDEDGLYEFSDLPAGNYRITAAKIGYTSMAYGQVESAEPNTPPPNRGQLGKPVQVSDGQIVTRIDISLPRYSAVTGQLLDDFGDPVENVAVSVSQIKFQAGRRRLVGVAGIVTRSTDDRGRYRLYGLTPGQYIVSASPGQVAPNQVASDLSGYAPTYFPGTPSPGEAQLVPVARSQDATAIDFVLVPTPTASISGKKLGSDGEPMGGSLMLMESQRSRGIITPAAGARISDDGRFEFPNVSPGEYVIQADRGRFNGGNEGDFVAQYVTVNGNSVSDLLLQSTPGSTITGHVVFDGDGPPPSLRTLAIVPERADLDLTPNVGSIARGGVNPDLTFQLTGIHGPRRLVVERPPPGWDLKSVSARGNDVTDAVLKFGTPDQSLDDVDVVLTNRLTEVIATIVDAHGQPTRDYRLLVFPDDRERWYTGSRYFRSVGPEPAGYADVRGLPPGEYLIAAVFGMSVLKDGVDAWQDPDFLESIAQRATRVTLTEGQRLSISARVITP